MIWPPSWLSLIVVRYVWSLWKSADDPRPSSIVHAQLLSSQYIDNVLETAVRLSPMHIIIELLNYCDTAQFWYSQTMRIGEVPCSNADILCSYMYFLFSSLDTEVGGQINCSNVGCRLWLRRNDQFFLFLKIDYLGWSLEFNHVPVRSLCAWFNNFTCGLDLQPLIGQIYLDGPRFFFFRDLPLLFFFLWLTDPSVGQIMEVFAEIFT